MIYTIQKNVSIISAGKLVTGCVSVTDPSGSSSAYGISVLADGSFRLNGCFDIEDSARRQAAQTFVTYQLVPISSIQVQRLSNGMIEVYDPAEPIHVGGNPTRYYVINGQVSTATYVAGSGPNTYIATANAFLSAHNF
jgi:hypothetical protein